MEYGEIIGALQHVASCAGSLRLSASVGASAWISLPFLAAFEPPPCVGADRAQSFERQAGPSGPPGRGASDCPWFKCCKQCKQCASASSHVQARCLDSRIQQPFLTSLEQKPLLTDMRSVLLANFGVALALLGDSRPWLHLFAPPFETNAKVVRNSISAPHGVDWSPGPNMLSFGLDPATAVHSMLDAADFVYYVNGSNGSSEKQMALRLKFTNDVEVLRHRRRVLQTFLDHPETCGRCNKTSIELGKVALRQLLAFKEKGYVPSKPLNSTVELLVPVRLGKGTESTPLAEFLARQVSRVDMATVFGGEPGPNDYSRPVSVQFFEGFAYIVDERNHRVLKVKPGEAKAEIFFGGRGAGDSLDQLAAYPSGITFFEGHAYIADQGNHRILKVKPGNTRGEVFFGGPGLGDDLDHLESPSGITFFDGHAYIADEGNNRILKVKPGNTTGEVFFGGQGRGDDLDHLESPSGITFFDGHAYIADQGNNRILKVKKGNTRGKLFFGGQGRGDDLDQLDRPSGITFFDGHAYIADKFNERILKVKPGNTTGEVFFYLGSINWPSGITFFEGHAYIADKFRILKVQPGNNRTGEVFFGEQRYGNDLDQLRTASGITFFEGHAYIADKFNHRILKVKPGNTTGELFFGGEYLSGITFFEGRAYIADEFNHRILKVKPGNTTGEVFFGGQGRGDDLDQLSSPSGITFFEGHAYIADKFNDRILKVKPGNTRGEVFFGGQGRGDDLDQLSSPSGITFFEGHAYIADNFNERILKVKPGNTRGEVFFGGQGRGDDLDQLSSPSGITFFEGHAYIADTFNNRILKVKPGDTAGEVFLVLSGPAKGLVFVADTAFVLSGNSIVRVARVDRQVDLYSNSLTLASTLLKCSSAVKLLEKEASTCPWGGAVWLPAWLLECWCTTKARDAAPAIFLLTGDDCSIPLPSETLEEGHWGHLPRITADSTTAAVKFEAKSEEVQLPTAAWGRKLSFSTLLLAVVLPSILAHAAGSPAGHAIFLVHVLALGVWTFMFGFLHLPFLGVNTDSGVGCLQIASTVLLTVALPWAAVPLSLYWSFDHMAATSFTTRSVLEISCAMGTAWELHLCTAVSMTFSLSLWAIVLAAQVDSVSHEPLMELPNCAPECLQEFSKHPGGYTKRLQVYFGWAYGSMYDQYADLTTNLIMLSCGFEFAQWSLVALLISFFLQNIGGAVHILLYNSSEHKCRYALMCFVMAPPWELVDPSTLKSSGMYMTAMRLVFEDLAQMISQVFFTWLVYRNPFVIFNLATSSFFACLSAKNVAKYYLAPRKETNPTEPPLRGRQTDTEMRALLRGPR
ncbi:trim71 [Symbiodinium sp. CCMP2456]|nr:trim71 [Symbiodinium sp. CCMP2456]